MRKNFLALTALTLAAFFAPLSNASADQQIDKVVFTAAATAGQVGTLPTYYTGVNLSGTIDFNASYLAVWAWNGSSWVYLAPSSLSVAYSAQDSALYGKPVFRFYVSARAVGQFQIRYLDFDAFNGSQWIKMSATKGITTVSGNDIVKKAF